MPNNFPFGKNDKNDDKKQAKMDAISRRLAAKGMGKKGGKKSGSQRSGY